MNLILAVLNSESLRSNNRNVGLQIEIPPEVITVSRKLQVEVKNENGIFKHTALNRRQDDSESLSMEEISRRLQDLKQQFEGQNRREVSSCELSMNRILALLNSVSTRSNARNVGLKSEIPQEVINQISSLVEHLVSNKRDISNQPNDHVLREEAAKKILSAFYNAWGEQELPGQIGFLNNGKHDTNRDLIEIIAALVTRDRLTPQLQYARTSDGMYPNNQIILLNQVLSTLRDATQLPPLRQNASIEVTKEQEKFGTQLNEILASIDELKQKLPDLTKNEETPSDKSPGETERLINQILSTANEMKQYSMPKGREAGANNSTNGSLENSNLNKILKTLEEIKQNIRPTNFVTNESASREKLDTTNDPVLDKIYLSIKEIKDDIQAAKDWNVRGGNLSRQETYNYQDQNHQDFVQRNISQLGRDSGPMFSTVFVQPSSTYNSEANGFPLVPQISQFNPALLQAQRNAMTLGNQVPRLIPPLLGIPPGYGAPYPLPFVPPGVLPSRILPNQLPCQNNANLCSGKNINRLLAPGEIELCQSLYAGTNCQNSNCRTVPPHLYSHYCGRK